MSNNSQVTHELQAISDAALTACEAAEALARAANGIRCHTVPAPTAYDLLGSLKVLLWYLSEVGNHLPVGLAASLNDPRFAVYDRDPAGIRRDPAAQVVLASEHLGRLVAHLSAAADAAESAQVAINGQGWAEVR